MTSRVRDGQEMIRQMAPKLLPGRFVFRTISDPDEAARLLPLAQASFREAEGLSLILEARPEDRDAFRQITLEVHSALDGVGLSAAVTSELAAREIPVNLVAANHHDHIFVPEHLAEFACDALLRFSRAAGAGTEKD
ncbi:ACT domain-containing protein [Tropicimonas sp. IMCC6043]|uniref:ACT domain-containing protein n=1 Tax=Tropicimonas sp. IMCC6043 TaxID=2510645 RepID=UPI00101BD1F0|nr:ACT domain-containing protein [Tropicimonas sp. IMCC6043]RYH11099.1 ACT domain-containing protein [Tropicimonas sp. IMCC6043]